MWFWRVWFLINALFIVHCDKIGEDSGLSLTLHRCGDAAGTQGPVIAITKGSRRPDKWTDEFTSALGAPAGSTTFVTPNGFVNDDTLHKTCEKLPSSVRKCDRVCEFFTEFPVVKTVDGFGSHEHSVEAAQKLIDSSFTSAKERMNNDEQ
mmetsp:Transcript_12957/g.21581  ORF Transcript_12957/g.21581 Transcript_12957/m.21581 type:complete len:150 (+) Transcript_12957:119-568(+)